MIVRATPPPLACATPTRVPSVPSSLPVEPREWEVPYRQDGSVGRRLIGAVTLLDPGPLGGDRGHGHDDGDADDVRLSAGTMRGSTRWIDGLRRQQPNHSID